MEILREVSLKTYNTFGVDAVAEQFVHIEKEEDLVQLFQAGRFEQNSLLFLGGGSNMLFVGDYAGLVVRMAIKGIQHRWRGDLIEVQAAGGEVWHDLVTYCVDKGFGGIENLSLIPGTVGAAPVQNIGAYGVELQDVFYNCRAFELETGTFKTFYKEDCRFGYRDSIFKGELKGKYIITEINLLLSTQSKPNTTYGAINAELAARGIVQPTIKDVSTVVSAIRQGKLPDPSTIGNAGSFFKNPVVSEDTFRRLVSDFVDIVYYRFGNNQYKLAAGWLIEQCGWKGKVMGNVGTWKNQALVLVNHGKATGLEIYELSERIIESVKNRFGIRLEREVNVIGF
ncbi:UDP-N-acetylmuramate dehydrogenase [Olivibacter sp. XZL3]|uniref:UDP-N-acetylmuramate dehydrogenase n=1 Tax=Olivibacter sp. XZL3 TaxID=1735116 RepID=UPI001066595F|nr:UDP-N-acetylmuramate dehydrogenase [Olivibacter sp. XZL3]